MFLIDAIKHNVEKKFKTCFIFLRDCLSGGESQAYKIKPVLFLIMLCFLAVTKTLLKTSEKFILRRFIVLKQDLLIKIMILICLGK